MVYLTFWSMQVIFAAALTPALTRVMGQTAYGQAAACVAVAALLNALFSFHLYLAVQRAHAADDEEHARQLLGLAIGLALACGAIAYATGPWWSPLIGLGPFPVAVRYTVVWATLTAVTGPSIALVRSRDNLRAFIAASFAQSILANGLALVLVAFVRATAAAYILGQLVGEAVAAGIALMIEPPKLPLRSHTAKLVGSLRFTSALVPAAVASFLFDASDRLVIHADLGPEALARFAVADNIGGFAVILLQAVSVVWMPRLFAIHDAATRRRVLGKSRDALFLLVVAFVIALSAASPLLLRIWAPPSFDPSTLLLVTALVAAAALPASASVIYTQTLILIGRTRAIASAAIGMALLNLGLNLALVPTLGIDGSAAITFVCYTAGALRSRWMAGSAAPPTSTRTLILTITGVAVCIGLAGVPISGVLVAIRVVIAVAAGMMFVIQLAVLVRPAALLKHPRLVPHWVTTRMADRVP